MKRFTLSAMMLLAVSLVLAGVLVAGCTQDTGSAPAAAAGSQQASPTGTYAGNGSYGSHQFSGSPNFLSNETLMSSAAAQLGVPEQNLKDALTPTNGQRINFTDAANQLGVTPDQLRAALFPAGTFHHGNQTMAMMTTPAGQ